MGEKNEPFAFSGPIVWRPTPDYIDNADPTRLMRLHGLADFAELLRRSTQEVARPKP